MADNWDDIKVGDRVRLTGNNEVHEFTADFVNTRYGTIGTLHGNHYAEAGWSVEILQPPLPTEPGLYVTPEYQDGLDEGLWMRSPYGGWWQATATGGWDAVIPSDVPRDLVRLVKETQA